MCPHIWLIRPHIWLIQILSECAPIFGLFAPIFGLFANSRNSAPIFGLFSSKFAASLFWPDGTTWYKEINLPWSALNGKGVGKIAQFWGWTIQSWKLHEMWMKAKGKNKTLQMVPYSYFDEEYRGKYFRILMVIDFLPAVSGFYYVWRIFLQSCGL